MPEANHNPRPLTFWYRNHKGEVGLRHVMPNRIFFGTTDWYPDEQWLMAAYDLDKKVQRVFALERILGNFRQEDPSAPAPLEVGKPATISAAVNVIGRSTRSSTAYLVTPLQGGAEFEVESLGTTMAAHEWANIVTILPPLKP